MAKRVATKTAVINIRVDPAIKAAAEKAAAADRRSIASLVEKLIADHCGLTPAAGRSRPRRQV